LIVKVRVYRDLWRRRAVAFVAIAEVRQARRQDPF
jgi:hypothetical protein